MKRTLPLILTFVVGFFLVGEYFVPHWRYRVVATYVEEFGLVVVAVAFLLGIINLLRVNAPIIRDRGPDWRYKVIMLGAMVLTLFVGLAAGKYRQASDLAGAPWGDAGFLGLLAHGAVPLGVDGAPVPLYGWTYNAIFAPLNSTMFALLAFYVASASFRAFRARNFEATLLLSAAIVVMFFSVPFGEALLGDKASNLVAWVMAVPNTASRRAIFVGAALGAISTALRVLLGLERSHLGGG